MRCECGYEGEYVKSKGKARIYFFDKHTGEESNLLNWTDYPINKCPNCNMPEKQLLQISFIHGKQNQVVRLF